jgi:hypothetical protein
VSPRELVDALRAIIEPSARTAEQHVITLYVEGGPAELALAATFAANLGMTIAMTAPDSLIAVAPQLDVADARDRLEEIARAAKVAVGQSRATICGGVVDGPALDVEAWAPYPLQGGLWITPTLL